MSGRLKSSDTSNDERYDRVTRLLCELLDLPLAALSIMGETRQWLKSESGLPLDNSKGSGVFCDYIKHQSSMIEVHDANVDVRFSESEILLPDPHLVFYVGFPIVSPEGQVIGALCGFDTHARVLTPAELGSLRDLAGIVQNQFTLGVLANRDMLTGLYNRRYFDRRLEEEWRRQARVGVPVSLLFFDVDHFKHYNDAFGHPLGDRCLQRIADSAAREFGRVGDFVARYGGEEFVVLLSGTDASGAQHKAESLRSTIEKLEIEHAPSSEISVVTISIGGATAVPNRNASFKGLIESADQALYQAKHNGRNQVWWDNSD